ncbi:solute carrier family 22 member 7-like [Amphibalanus amphitrite]|uniref:solute carrier family 22 member 7-like n=1 Tax=Amphibalanus amphitrite TaxID=1232801 RepID=UPI001C916BFF|nr:solute carrier family 22 member 7-like [Amphibalanus amphitrite]
MSPRAVSAEQQSDENGLQRSDDSVLFEDVLERCCGTGRWQVLLVSYMSVMWLIFPSFTLSMIFVGATPKHKCVDGFDVNATFADLPEEAPRCHPLGDNSSSCTRWAFDKSVYESTVVTEWNLVCARKPLLSMLQSWMMIGAIVGSVVGGQLSDRFGRRPVFLPSMLFVIACSFSAALVSDYISFAVVRCLTGFAMASMIASQYVLVTELGGCKHRAALTTVTYLPYAFGIMLVAAASYGIRTRWLLQLAFAVPCVLFLPNFWLMPESPRWLLVQRRLEEACEVLRQGAHWNRRKMPPDDQVLKMMEDARRGLLAREAALKGDGERPALERALDLVRTPRMRTYTLASAYISFAISGSYYGISFDMTQLSSSPHLAGALSGLVEVPAYLIYPMLNHFGRCRCYVFFLFSTTVAMFLLFVKNDATLWLVLGLVGKLSISSAFSMRNSYLSEYMPTQQRGLALGVSQMAVRVGGAVSPFVVDLVSDVHELAPSAVFGAVVLVASLAALLLPETAGRPLPETVADVETTGRPIATAAAGGPGRGPAPAAGSEKPPPGRPKHNDTETGAQAAEAIAATQRLQGSTNSALSLNDE